MPQRPWPADDHAAPARGSAPVAASRHADAAPPEEPAEDPAWRLTAWLLPLGAATSSLLAAAQAIAGGLAPAVGYPAAALLALLALALRRDARRRAARRRWVRDEVAEYALPLGVLLVALAALVHGADLTTCAPALLALVPVAWEFARAPHVDRPRTLFPHALPVLDPAAPANPAPGAPPDPAHAPAAGDDPVEAIVRDVLDGLPPDIAARLASWDVEVADAYPAPTPGRIIFGCCFPAAHVIAIYRRPHLRHHGRGDALRPAVAYTVLHEVAHALGLDETGVRRLGPLSDGPPLPDPDPSSPPPGS